MTHYETLGVSETATQDEIKQAYRELAKKHHPDAGGDEDLFKKIQEAYGVLKDPTKRAEYDAMRQPRQRRYTSQSHGPFTFRDFGIDIDGFTEGFRWHDDFGLNLDVKTSVDVKLEDLYNECEKFVEIRQPDGEKDIVRFVIPSAVEDGARLKYDRLGHRANGKRGALIVTVNLKMPAGWKKSRLDLITTLRVDAIQAMTGCKQSVTLPNNKTIRVTVPPGTQPGSVLRVRGQGLPYKDQIGNLHIEVQVQIPRVDDEKVVDELKRLFT